MDPETILQRAQEPGDLPAGWTVIPLNRQIVRQSVWYWVMGTAVGFGLFALLFASVAGQFYLVSIATILLAVLGFVGGGSAYLAIQKLLMLADAERYIIVLTPDHFVQQRGAQVIAVPTDAIEAITLRGVFGGVDDTLAQDRDVLNASMNFTRFLGGTQRHRTRRTPDSLAFVDRRNQQEVVVAEDNSFTELPVLEEYLRRYAAGEARLRTN